MKTVIINGAAITDASSFHSEFQRALGFPEFYGRNMDAWIDCMSNVDEPSAGLSTVDVSPGEILVLQIDRAHAFKSRCPELWAAFLLIRQLNMVKKSPAPAQAGAQFC
ncbi:MAG: barstar family protein [Rhodocyclaceae bacterium]|nr:barstar family protein [Rhodocyclaceae bacterium]